MPHPKQLRLYILRDYAHLFSSEVCHAFYDHHHLSQGEWLSYAEKNPPTPLKRPPSPTSIHIPATANIPLRSEQFRYRGCDNHFAQ